MVVFTISNFESPITNNQQITSLMKWTLKFHWTKYFALCQLLVLGIWTSSFTLYCNKCLSVSLTCIWFTDNNFKSKLPCFLLNPLQSIVSCSKLLVGGKLFSMINRKNNRSINWMSISWRYNKMRSIIYFCIARRNINFWCGILGFGIVWIIYNFRWNNWQHNRRLNLRCQFMGGINGNIHYWNSAKS